MDCQGNAALRTANGCRAAARTWGGYARRSSVAILLCAVACGVSPKPEPPVTVPKPPTFEAVPRVDTLTASSVGITADPLTVDPPDGILRAYNLETADPPHETPIQTDGSFELLLPGRVGDELRFELLLGSTGSAPKDWIVAEPGSALAEVDAPLRDCFVVTPSILFVSRGETVMVTVEDICGLGVELDEPRPRNAPGAFGVGEGQSWPLTLQVGHPVELPVVASGGEAGDEEIYFVEASAPELDRRAVTLRIVP